MARTYSNFRLPPLHSTNDLDQRVHPTLVDQSEGRASIQSAHDAEPASSAWRSIRCHQVEAVRLYEAGRSLTSISNEVGIAWDSVARLLDRAGVRERKNKDR